MEYPEKTLKMLSNVQSGDWNFVCMLEVIALREQNKKFSEAFEE